MAAKTLRVLVVDDDEVMRELLTALLSAEGHGVSTAEDGEGALRMLGQASFDVILSDLQLPGMTGQTFAEQVRTAPNTTAVLLGMSGSSPSEVEVAAFDAFLGKPFATEAFINAVQDAQSRRASAAVTKAGPPEPTPASASSPRTAVLDRKIFDGMAKTLRPAQLRELYDLTLRDVAERLARMEAADEANDHELMKREAHAIKGACGMVGAAELRELAAAVEGGALRCTPPFADFRAACDRLKRMLDETFQDADAAS